MYLQTKASAQNSRKQIPLFLVYVTGMYRVFLCVFDNDALVVYLEPALNLSSPLSFLLS